MVVEANALVLNVRYVHHTEHQRRLSTDRDLNLTSELLRSAFHVNLLLRALWARDQMGCSQLVYFTSPRLNYCWFLAFQCLSRMWKRVPLQPLAVCFCFHVTFASPDRSGYQQSRSQMWHDWRRNQTRGHCPGWAFFFGPHWPIMHQSLFDSPESPPKFQIYCSS